MQLNALLKPLKLSAAISLVGLLTACSGNSSSSSAGPAPIIDPITVDKSMAAVEWGSSNYETNASHAYRVITKNSMLKYVFTDQLAAFHLFVNLFRVDTDKNCAISGRIVAEQGGDICYGVDGTTPEDCADNSPITENIQKSQAIACQDGTVVGQYFDGFFNITERIDLITPGEQRSSTIISAEGHAQKYDKHGEPIFDENNKPELEYFTDYLFQSDIATFFFDHQYESYVDFSDDKGVCGEGENKTEYNKVVRQGVRSKKVGTQEGDGVDDFYLYTEFTVLDLQAIPAYDCEDATGKVTTDYTYSFSATTMTNAAMGGTDVNSDPLVTSNTSVDWPDMDISVEKDSSGMLVSKPSGTMTLVHENTTGNYSVVVNFNVDGQVTLTPSIGAPSTLTLSEFLELSKPVAPEPVVE